MARVAGLLLPVAAVVVGLIVFLWLATSVGKVIGVDERYVTNDAN
jgi:hypothetical protein